MNTKFFGEPNKNKFIKELKKVLGDIGGSKIKDFTEGHFTKIDALGNLVDAGMAITELTQAEYDALTEKDTNTVYVIKNLTDIANGHEYVDLGLTDEEENKIMFSPCNLGANSPEQPGDYYAWGEIETKENYSWNTYKWGTASNLTKYNWDSNRGIVDNKTILDIEDDIVNIQFGGYWHIPTKLELNIFVNQCSFVWTTQNNRNGFLVTGINGATIFIPASGYKYNNTEDQVNTMPRIWSSNIVSADDTEFDPKYPGNGIQFSKNALTNMPNLTKWGRSDGICIRPVLTIPKDYNPEVIGYKLYKGSILIADSNLPNEIEQLLASI